MQVVSTYGLCFTQILLHIFSLSLGRTGSAYMCTALQMQDNLGYAMQLDRDRETGDGEVRFCSSCSLGRYLVYTRLRIQQSSLWIVDLKEGVGSADELGVQSFFTSGICWWSLVIGRGDRFSVLLDSD